MSKSTILVIVIVAILAIGGVVALTHKPNAPSTTVSSSNTAPATSSNSTNQVATSGTINIKDMMFTPPQITVQKGGTVTWTNNDTTTHTVTDDLTGVGGPNSGNIEPGSTYSFTFDRTGSFQYHCSIHPSMRGTIVVK